MHFLVCGRQRSTKPLNFGKKALKVGPISTRRIQKINKYSDDDISEDLQPIGDYRTGINYINFIDGFIYICNKYFYVVLK